MIWPFTKINRLRSQNSFMAWAIRASFELGYRAAKPDCDSGEWRDDWRKSDPRKELVKMGYIKEEDMYR